MSELSGRRESTWEDSRQGAARSTKFVKRRDGKEGEAGEGARITGNQAKLRVGHVCLEQGFAN